MSRPLTTAVAAAIAASNYVDFFITKLDFASGTVRATSLPYSITWDDGMGEGPQTWLGVGRFGSISAVEEGSEVKAYVTTLTLSGVDLDQVAIAMTDKCQGRDGYLWQAFCDPKTHVMLADPVVLFPGIMDTMSIRMGQTATITVTLQNRLARWETPNPTGARWTDQDQQAKVPGDTFFKYVSESASKSLIWGQV